MSSCPAALLSAVVRALKISSPREPVRNRLPFRYTLSCNLNYRDLNWALRPAGLKPTVRAVRRLMPE